MNGEQAAAAFLKNKGYKIIQTNYRVAGAEVDLVASTGDILCFVEVKTRKTCDFGAPEAFVTRPKQLKIIRAARIFLGPQALPRFPGALRRGLGPARRRRHGLRPPGKRLRGVSRCPNCARTRSPAPGSSFPRNGKKGRNTTRSWWTRTSPCPENCPFCPGNEAMTPPETFALRPGHSPAERAGLGPARRAQQVPGPARRGRTCARAARASTTR